MLACCWAPVAVYVASAEAVGLAGLCAFLVGLAGVASIVGPDTTAFRIDLYRIGALVFVTGLASLAVQLLRGRAMGLTASLWLATFLASLASACCREICPSPASDQGPVMWRERGLSGQPRCGPLGVPPDICAPDLSPAEPTVGKGGPFWQLAERKPLSRLHKAAVQPARSLPVAFLSILSSFAIQRRRRRRRDPASRAH